jgi:hypothetical protein
MEGAESISPDESAENSYQLVIAAWAASLAVTARHAKIYAGSI